MNSTPQPIQYLKCSKAGLHDHQNLNIVCLQTSCLENLVCCCACVETQHKKHKTRPLKMVMAEAKAQTNRGSGKQINIDIMLDIAKEHQRASFQLFHKYKSEITSNLENIQTALQGYYSHTLDQILIKNSDSNLLIEQALLRAAVPNSFEELKVTVKKLAAVLCEQAGRGTQMGEEELVQSLKDSSQSIRRSISSSMEEVNSRLSKYQASIMSLINSTTLWQTSYKFSATFKHPDVKLVNQLRVKAANNSGYKFAIMEPGVGKMSNKAFSFEINECTSNWLALGFCLRRVVESKNYSFSFGTIGHGAYMISANGGSWSHTKSQYNNTVKAIKFGKGDVVHATVDQQGGKIVFSKNSSQQKYELPFIGEENDELHPCVLFYYINDEVRYLPKHLPTGQS